MTTIAGSLLETFFPKVGIWPSWTKSARASPRPSRAEEWWNKKFEAVACETLADFDTMMGHEIALEIATRRPRRSRLPSFCRSADGHVPLAVFFLKAWNVDCKHVHGFNMDEWSDAEGNTLPADDPARSRRHGTGLLRPARQAHRPGQAAPFCTTDALPKYAGQIKC